MTAEDIIQFLKENEVGTWNNYLHGTKRAQFEEKLGKIDECYAEGGNEGEGDYVERVHHYLDHGVYIRFTGFYSSDNGTEWEREAEEVEPREVVVTQYFTKSKA